LKQQGVPSVRKRKKRANKKRRKMSSFPQKLWGKLPKGKKRGKSKKKEGELCKKRQVVGGQNPQSRKKIVAEMINCRYVSSQVRGGSVGPTDVIYIRKEGGPKPTMQ